MFKYCKHFLDCEIKPFKFSLNLCNKTLELSVFTELASNLFLAAVRFRSFFVLA